MAANGEGGTGNTLAAVAVVTVTARLVVAALLLFGPWTDEPFELGGWDAERFQEIIDDERKPWVEHPVEYPPGSVLTLEALGGADVVGTNRNLVALSVVIDLATAVGLGRLAGIRAAKWYLVFGLALLPMGYVRLDTLVVGLATAAALTLLGRGSKQSEHPERQRPSSPAHLLAAGWSVWPFAGLVAAGALIKIWPALLVAGALAVGRRGAASVAIGFMALGGIAWLVWAGDGLEPMQQVLSLRGATGWHVESLPGSIVALTGNAEAQLEFNAFRIGSINQSIVLAGRAVAVATIIALALVANRSSSSRTASELSDSPGSEAGIGDTERFGLVMLGSTAALLATAPLLSPQFILWLLPWAALIAGNRALSDPPLVLSALVALLTGAILTIFGPPNLDETLPALLLTVRNLALVALPLSCGLRLMERPVAGVTPRPKSSRSASLDR